MEKQLEMVKKELEEVKYEHVAAKEELAVAKEQLAQKNKELKVLRKKLQESEAMHTQHEQQIGSASKPARSKMVNTKSHLPQLFRIWSFGGLIILILQHHQPFTTTI